MKNSLKVQHKCQQSLMKIGHFCSVFLNAICLKMHDKTHFNNFQVRVLQTIQPNEEHLRFLRKHLFSWRFIFHSSGIAEKRQERRKGRSEEGRNERRHFNFIFINGEKHSHIKSLTITTNKIQDKVTTNKKKVTATRETSFFEVKVIVIPILPRSSWAE